MRRILLGVLAALLIAAAVAGVVLSRGTFETYPRSGLAGAGAPAWTAPCRADSGVGRDHTTCVRVAGRVVWIQKHDPDGDGDRHLIVITRLHPRIVKVPRDFPLRHLPSLGSWVDATGWVVVGASGHNELEPRLMHASGEVVRAPVRGR
ncbi:hypothetical protein [Baekduia sp. Peel2402]|uniref:hypothetical protein n=1 Tax=Baekduia sp. Peel2402 TaxID=3458296 RepID=UPI00403E77D9